VRAFTCGNCHEQLVFFENTSCLHCKAPLGYLPDSRRVVALVPLERDRFAVVASGEASGDLAPSYRRCSNAEIAACNWLVADGAGPASLCASCALTRTRPSDRDAVGLARFAKAEAAKRRLLFQLHEIGLPVVSKADDPRRGLAFDLLSSHAGKVVTGHSDGLITLDLAESDDAYRERTRHELGEAYRTLLGHLRHEIGHYFWDELIEESSFIDDFRLLFGDERASYSKALERHYREGAPTGWSTNYVSAYATMHPFEDFAETFSHYLHVHDTLQTANAAGLVIVGPLDDATGRRDRGLAAVPSDNVVDDAGFDAVVREWLPLTYALNVVNRSMGRDDLYPFVLPAAVIKKLAFVHQVVRTTVGSVRSGVGA